MDNLEAVKCEKLLLHFKYVALILFLMFVFAATGAWTDRVNFTEYLTNAATMISIVLGLVAIFYSFVSNTSLNQSLGNISNVSSGIEKSNQLVNQYVAQAEQLNKANLQNSSYLSTVSLNIEENLQSLSSLLHQLNDKSSQLETTVSTIPDRFEKLENAVFETTKDFKVVDSNSKKSKINWSAEDIEQYIDRSTVSANIAIYAIVQFAKERTKFNHKDLFTAIDTSTSSYLRGFIAGSYAVGLFKRNIDGDYFTITDVQPALQGFDIMASINDYLNTSTSLSTEQKNEYHEVIRKVNKFISITMS